jgi:hypothetical protein
MNYFDSSKKNLTYFFKWKSVMEMHLITKFTNHFVFMLFFVWNIWMYEKMKCITYLLKFSNADCNGSGFTMTKTLFSVHPLLTMNQIPEKLCLGQWPYIYIYIYVVYMLLFYTSNNLYKIFMQVITCVTPSYKL